MQPKNIYDTPAVYIDEVFISNYGLLLVVILLLALILMLLIGISAIILGIK